MTLRVSLILCLLLVASCPAVMGMEVLGTSYFSSWWSWLMGNSDNSHWLKTDPTKTDCTAMGELIVDPDDCHKFYYCIAAGTTAPDPLPCAEDAYQCFANSSDTSTVGTCIAPDTVGANETCDAACNGGGSGGECTFECPTEPGSVAASQDCSKFILCHASGEIELDCPSDKPYFDGKTCGTDQAACCNCKVPTTESNCKVAEDATKTFADPHDCHQFYICLDLNADSTLALEGPFPCPNGGSFDGTECTDKTECDPPCAADANSTPGSDPTTSGLGSTTGDTSSDSSDAGGTTPGGDGCTDEAEFICPASGYYARCPFCDPSYFKCENTASKPSLGQCSGDLVFNPTPEFAYCIRPENCPFGL